MGKRSVDGEQYSYNSGLGSTSFSLFIHPGLFAIHTLTPLPKPSPQHTRTYPPTHPPQPSSLSPLLFCCAFFVCVHKNKPESPRLVWANNNIVSQLKYTRNNNNTTHTHTHTHTQVTPPKIPLLRRTFCLFSFVCTHTHVAWASLSSLCANQHTLFLLHPFRKPFAASYNKKKNNTCVSS